MAASCAPPGRGSEADGRLPIVQENQPPTSCPASAAPYGYERNGNPLPEAPLEPVYPELWASGVGGLYSLFARAILGLAPVVTDGAVAS